MYVAFPAEPEEREHTTTSRAKRDTGSLGERAEPGDGEEGGLRIPRRGPSPEGAPPSPLPDSPPPMFDLGLDLVAQLVVAAVVVVAIFGFDR
jgi:hypothetical protein